MSDWIIYVVVVIVSAVTSGAIIVPCLVYGCVAALFSTAFAVVFTAVFGVGFFENGKFHTSEGIPFVGVTCLSCCCIFPAAALFGFCWPVTGVSFLCCLCVTMFFCANAKKMM